MVVLTADLGGCGKKSDMQIVYCRTNCIEMVVFEQKIQMLLVFNVLTAVFLIYLKKRDLIFTKQS